MPSSFFIRFAMNLFFEFELPKSKKQGHKKFGIDPSHPQIYLSDSTSPTSSFFLASIPSFPILPSSRFLRYTPTIASSSPHHPSLHPLFLNTSLYLPSPISHSTTSLISSFNSLYFAYFLPSPPTSLTIKPNSCFIFGPFDYHCATIML